jgi:hypothetical protein
MKKINHCAICGKMILDADICPICLNSFKRNDDPFEVTIGNLISMMQTYKDTEDTKEKLNILRELDYASNQSYMRGYISEENYKEICDFTGLTPLYTEFKQLSKDGYDTSNYAKIGFYNDLVAVTKE